MHVLEELSLAACRNCACEDGEASIFLEALKAIVRGGCQHGEF